MDEAKKFCNDCRYYKAETMFCLYKKAENDPLQVCDQWESKPSNASYIDAAPAQEQQG